MLKQLAAASLMLCAVGGAQAWDAGPINIGDPVIYTEPTHSPGEFWDTVTFSVANVKLGVSANSLTVSSPFDSSYVRHITDLNYTILFDGAEVVSYNGGLTPSYTVLTAGDYELRINGIADGSTGGTYGLALLAAPVPEPATIGMLMAGLGILGLARRQSNSANDKFS